MNETPATVMTTTINKPIGKISNPWTVLILSIVTLGIYGIVWHYCIFEELKNWRGQGWSGTVFIIFFLIFGIALIAIPWLIPAYVGRIRRWKNKANYRFNRLLGSTSNNRRNYLDFEGSE